jgi:hypothetical protein
MRNNGIKFSLRDLYPSVQSVYSTRETTIPDSEESKAYQATETENGTLVHGKEEKGNQIKFFVGAIILLILIGIKKGVD